MVSTLKKFEEIPVYTKTFIVVTNISVDIQKLYEFLPLTDYKVVSKKDGNMNEINRHVPNGSIITLKLANNVKGVLTKSTKKSEKTEKKTKTGRNYFRNSLTIVMVVEGKRINFKISKNGKFQMTGCKNDQQAEQAVKYFWEYIQDTSGIYEMAKKPFKALFVPAMRNMDFSIGFPLDREKLNDYINTQTENFSLYETDIGYTGVNIKFPAKKSITEIFLKELTYRGKRWMEPKMISYEKYLNSLDPKEREKKIAKNRYITFLVFHSGKVICSSMCDDFAKDAFNDFSKMISENSEVFREKLVEK